MDDTTNHTTAATAATGINPLLFRSSDIADLFADLEPIPQDDGPDMVCCIDYPPGFTTVYDTFRAVLAAQEISPRVFGLTSLCLHHNSANYTVWHVRRTCFLAQLLPTTHETETTDEALERAKTMYRQELEYTASLGGSNPKNYQIWYHRRSLLESLLSMKDEPKQNSLGGGLLAAWLQEELAREEFAYMDSVVRADGKNYHAWSHRQWLVLTLQQLARRTSPSPQQQEQQQDDDRVSMWQSELDTTTSLIALDIRNNSAWNHRWFLLHHPEPPAFHNTDSSTTTTTPTAAAAVTRLDPAVLESQVQFALDQIVVDPYNESSCRFLVALLKEEARASADQNASSLTLPSRALTTLHDEVLTTLDPTAVPVLSASVDLYELLVRSKQDKDHSETIQSLLTQLTSVDPIRTKYWKWRLEQHTQTTSS